MFWSFSGFGICSGMFLEFFWSLGFALECFGVFLEFGGQRRHSTSKQDPGLVFGGRLLGLGQLRKLGVGQIQTLPGLVAACCLRGMPNPDGLPWCAVVVPLCKYCFRGWLSEGF